MDVSTRTILHSCEDISITFPSCPLTSFLGEIYFFVQSWLGTLALFLIQRVSHAPGSLHPH